MKYEIFLIAAIVFSVETTPITRRNTDRLQRSLEDGVLMEELQYPTQVQLEPIGNNPNGLPLDQTSPHLSGDFPTAEQTNTDAVQVPQVEAKEVEEDDDVSETDSKFMPMGNGRVYNFFPISFGGGLGRSGLSGGSTAIANSFSTGRRGTASSTSTAYGNPSYFRNTN